VPSPTIRLLSIGNAEIVPIENAAVAATVALSRLTIGKSVAYEVEQETPATEIVKSERTAAYLAGGQVGCSFGRGYSKVDSIWGGKK
jgi:hypothetical protein